MKSSNNPKSMNDAYVIAPFQKEFYSFRTNDLENNLNLANNAW